MKFKLTCRPLEAIVRRRVQSNRPRGNLTLAQDARGGYPTKIAQFVPVTASLTNPHRARQFNALNAVAKRLWLTGNSRACVMSVGMLGIAARTKHQLAPVAVQRTIRGTSVMCAAYRSRRTPLFTGAPRADYDEETTQRWEPSYRRVRCNSLLGALQGKTICPVRAWLTITLAEFRAGTPCR